MDFDIKLSLFSYPSLIDLYFIETLKNIDEI